MKKLIVFAMLLVTGVASAQTLPMAPALRSTGVPGETEEAKRQETLRLGVTACMRLQSTNPRLAASDDCKLLRQKWDEAVKSNMKLQNEAASKQIEDAVNSLKK